MMGDNMVARMLWKKITCAAVCLAMAAALFGCGNGGTGSETSVTSQESTQTTPATPAASDKVVLLIDPGHDSAHPGATGIGGVKEEDLTLQVGKMLEEQLQQYSNVEVYMTRETSACPYPDAGGSVEDNRARCAYAEEIGADFMISLHFNSGSGDATANGSMILIQNTNYEPTYNQMGQDLGGRILGNLASLGFANRGFQTKDMTDDVEPEQQTYPDGSRSDYYAILHHAKLHHVPAIIVEHGFITNQEDLDRISGTENLQKLADADAQAIVEYFGLVK